MKDSKLKEVISVSTEPSDNPSDAFLQPTLNTSYYSLFAIIILVLLASITANIIIIIRFRKRLQRVKSKLSNELEERLMAEEARKRSEAKFGTLYQSSSDAIMLFAKDRFVDCNDSTLQVFGCETRAEFCSMHPADVSPPYQPNGIESKFLADKNISKAVQLGSHSFEWMHRKTSGEDFPAEVILNVVDFNETPIIQAIVHDISERIAAQEKLSRTLKQLQTVLDASSQVSIISTDKNGLITSFNTGAEKMLGYSADEMVLKQTPVTIHLESEIIEHGKELSKEFGRIIEGFEVFVAKAVKYGFEEKAWTYIRKDGSHLTVSLAVTAIKNEFDEIDGLLGVALDISELKKKEEELKRLSIIIEQSTANIIISDIKGKISYVNPAYLTNSGYSSREILGRNFFSLIISEKEILQFQKIWEMISNGEVWQGRIKSLHKNGSKSIQEATIYPIRDNKGAITNHVAIMNDITEQLRLEMELQHAQKMESIGQLASGIAHEINTPIQFVGDSTYFLQEAYEDLSSLLATYTKLCKQAEGNKEYAQVAKEIEEIKEEIDLDFLLEEIPKSIERTLTGVDRVATIVKAMKEFAHPDSKEKVATDINKAIENTLIVAKNEYKYVADIDTNLESLPAIDVIPGDINQVLINMIVNAAHSLESVVKETGKKGTIRISTNLFKKRISIAITDNGSGIPEEIRDKIFDPFFTTKEVGKGSGQGLMICHSIIVEKHGGTITVDSELGKGTTFSIMLPLQHSENKES